LTTPPTDEQRAMVLDSLGVGITLDVAARKAGATVAACKELAASDKAWALAMARAAEPAAETFAEFAARQPVEAPAAKQVPPAVGLGYVASFSDEYEEIAAEALAYAPGPLGFFLRLDAKCIDAGMHAISPWWRYAIGEGYASGKSWWIFEVGRGGGKSVTLERLAASESRYTPRKVPPGQIWSMPFISVGPSDANRRINGIAAVFRADGLSVIGEEDTSGSKHKTGVKITRAPRGAMGLLDVHGNQIELGSIAGTIGNVSGPSTIGMLIDEAAKLLDSATGANPLTEIITSGAQTSRGRQGWIGIVCSSAMWRSGAHFELIEQGDNEVNYVAKIGAAFLDEARRGFELVAAWEDRRGDRDAAQAIRAHAASLTASSPQIPSFLANPTLGNPTAEAWEGAALASRMLVEVLPANALGGHSRISFWLRECGSVPMASSVDEGADARAQIMGIAAHRAERSKSTVLHPGYPAPRSTGSRKFFL
jgi:hypothetical protein